MSKQQQSSGEMITLVEQIREVERELALRRRVYPAMVSVGRMKQNDATKHMACMEAVLATLRGIERQLLDQNEFAP